MAHRSSRHKSHRSHKNRDRSDSEEEADSRERKPREEEEETRVSRVSETEKQRSLLGKDLVGSSNGDFSGEHGKKRKDRGEDSADRWKGGGGGNEDAAVDKVSRKDGMEVMDTEKNSKLKACGSDSKGTSSSRRREGSSERNEERKRSEKESSRRESSSCQYKDDKERDKERERERERGKESEKEKERVPEKDRKVQDSRNERSGDGGSRKDERVVKKDIVNSDLQEEMRNPELEKELEKRMKWRRDGSGDNDNLQGRHRESDARRISSRDDHSKNGSHKDERYKDARYREKHRDVLDRDQKQPDDKRRDEHTTRVHTSDRSDNKHSRDVLDRDQKQPDDKRRDEHTTRVHTSDRSDNKHSRDDNRLSDSRYKTKPQHNDHDGSPHADERGTRLKDNRGRKRSSDEIEDFSDVKPRSTKESHEDTERSGSRSSKLESRADRARIEHPHSEKVDSGPSNNRPKSSPRSSAYVKDQNRHTSRPAESSRRELLSEEARRSRTVSKADHPTASGGRERISESRSLEKNKLKDDIRSDVHVAETAASHYDKTIRSDGRTSPKQFREKSPSTSDWRSERMGGKRILDMEEVGQRSSGYKDGRDSSTKDNGRDWEMPVEKLKASDSSQVDLPYNEPTSYGPSSYNRTSNVRASSPGHLPPPPPMRLGVDSPSVLGSYEDENRVQSGDRKANSRYKRNSDVSVGRGQGTPWRSTPTWSPAPNGFRPLQHGPPVGFHPAIQQFPGPPLFGIRPPMDLNHTGLSYHPHEANRFSGHSRPYGWHNPVDDCPPHLQVWDGSNNMFGDESHMYGRPDWDQNRHLMGGRGWEMNIDMWNGQNGNMNMKFPVPRKEQEYSTQGLADETWSGQSRHRSREERARSELPTADATGINWQNDISPAKNAVGTTPKPLYERVTEPSKIPNVPGKAEDRGNKYVRFCRKYLSKLDISPDLVPPDMYKECIPLMGEGDGIVASNISIQGHQKNTNVVAKRKHPIIDSLKSRSPTTSDAIFQRAMSLYNKQTEWMKEAMHKEENLSSAHDGANVDANSPNDMVEDLPMTDAADDMEVGKETAIDAEADHPEFKEEKLDYCSIDTDEDRQCDKISESAVLAEGSEISESAVLAEGSEALMPECRVNLSRIHLSPESTH